MLTRTTLVATWLVAAVLMASGYAAAGQATKAPASHEAPLLWRDDLSPGDRERVAKILKSDPAAVEPFENMPAGKATFTGTLDTNAFSHFPPSLSFEDEQRFKIGNGLFRKIWVSSPASTQASDGLGPLFNARACQQCHVKDGRGRPPLADEPMLSMLMKAVISDGAGVRPDPDLGEQIQNFSVAGVPAEAETDIRYTSTFVTVNAGSGKTKQVELLKPSYQLRALHENDEAAGLENPDRILGPRVAPQMIGLGLLQAIHVGDLEVLADEEDADGDGISGRIHHLPQPTVENQQAPGPLVGRFGWKATTANIRQQSADAFFNDMGLSTSLRPGPWGDCTVGQVICRSAPHGVGSYGDIQELHEVSDEALDLVEFYSANLAVPQRRDVDEPVVLEGKQLFHAAGCASCHTPKFVTSRHASQGDYQFQLIWPYTDLLLHDMGPELADNIPVGAASGSEWRTAPLWGIGLTEMVNGHTRYLHDGRARNLLEAILWHGGEAAAARDRVAAMEPAQRSALVRFVESL
ncbi:di-heme oxidoredictase family protein [Allohahella marinimesophila]|uniref:Di-heme oxidoredictase family protein n=2 Tax=Allohahella marinimesophila TaxID=1054972 RepID=A0ABP7PCM6_9GAMM